LVKKGLLKRRGLLLGPQGFLIGNWEGLEGVLQKTLTTWVWRLHLFWERGLGKNSFSLEGIFFAPGALFKRVSNG